MTPLAFPTWMDDAACLTVDPGLFISDDSRNGRVAKQICGGCPVRAKCLVWALNMTPAVDGVWGGTTARERSRIRAHGHPQAA